MKAKKGMRKAQEKKQSIVRQIKQYSIAKVQGGNVRNKEIREGTDINLN